MGFSVITAANGAEAVAAYRMNQDLIALVILDVAMPVMSGIECFRRLKEVSSEVCVLIASGYAKNGDVDGLLAAGAVGLPRQTLRQARVAPSNWSSPEHQNERFIVDTGRVVPSTDRF